jgi:hypothetical protein
VAFTGQSQQISVIIDIANTGLNSTIALNTVKVRYYFGVTSQPPSYSFTCDNAQINGGATFTSAVSGTVVSNPSTTPGANEYLELSFGASAPAISGAGASAKVQARFWGGSSYPTVFTPTSDYSYMPIDGGTPYNTHITATLDGTLAWGTPP